MNSFPENYAIINPSQMSRFPYFLLGNVYFAQSITVGMLIGESTVICAEIKGMEEEEIQVDFLPFNNGEIKLFNLIRGTTKILTTGLMLILLAEPIGKILAQTFKDDENAHMLAMNSNGLFSFIEEHINKNEEMSEMRNNGFLENNLTIIGYLQNNLSFLKKSLSQRNSSLSSEQTLTSTFANIEDIVRKSSLHFLFKTEMNKCDLNNNFTMYEKNGCLINSYNTTYLFYQIEKFNHQKGTPLFIKVSSEKKTEYILLGFYLENQKNMLELSSMSNELSISFPIKNNFPISKGLLLTNKLYQEIIGIVNQKTVQKASSSIFFTKSIVSFTSTYCIVNHYFFNIYSCKGILNKHFSLSNIFKVLSDIYNIPQQYLQFSIGNPELFSPSNDSKLVNQFDSFMDSLFLNINHDGFIEINIFCEVNIELFGQHLSKNITRQVKNAKLDQKNSKKLLLKKLFKEIKQYENLSFHFYGLLFNNLKSVLIH